MRDCNKILDDHEKMEDLVASSLMLNPSEVFWKIATWWIWDSQARASLGRIWAFVAIIFFSALIGLYVIKAGGFP